MNLPLSAVGEAGRFPGCDGHADDATLRINNVNLIAVEQTRHSMLSTSMSTGMPVSTDYGGDARDLARNGVMTIKTVDITLLPIERTNVTLRKASIDGVARDGD